MLFVLFLRALVVAMKYSTADGLFTKASLMVIGRLYCVGVYMRAYYSQAFDLREGITHCPRHTLSYLLFTAVKRCSSINFAHYPK